MDVVYAVSGDCKGQVDVDVSAMLVEENRMTMETTEQSVAQPKKARPGSDYKKNDPKGWCGDPRRGAALGRPSYDVDEPLEWTGKLYVSEVRLQDGGYDENGTYFGHGDPLFWVRNATYEIDYVIRVPSRVLALGVVQKEYPKATFARGPSKDEAEWLSRMMGDGR